MNSRVYALLLSVGDYRQTGLSNLPAFRMDAALLATALDAGLKVPADHLRIMTGAGNSGTVRAMDFARAVAEFKPLLKDENIFLLYFSGHGKGQSLCFSDGPLKLQSVIDYVADLPAKSKLIILDCCNSGGFESRGAAAMQLGERVADFAERGIAVLAATTPDGNARLVENGTHSMFTGALSAAILFHKHAKNGMLTLNDICDETKELVTAWNGRNPGKEQTPVIRVSMGGTIFFPVTNPDRELSPSPQIIGDDFRVVTLKALDTTTEKRFAAVTLTDGLFENEKLARITKRIAGELGSEGSSDEASAGSSDEASAGSSAGASTDSSAGSAAGDFDFPEVVWCYFCQDESDLAADRFYARGIYAREAAARKKYYRSSAHSVLIGETCIVTEPSYVMLRNHFQPELTAEEYLERSGKLIALIVTLAEGFIFDFRETENQIPHPDKSNEAEKASFFSENYRPWISAVKKNYLELMSLPLPPAGLEEWASAVSDLAGWVTDIGLSLENNVTADPEMIRGAIRRYHESMHRIKELEDGRSHFS